MFHSYPSVLNRDRRGFLQSIQSRWAQSIPHKLVEYLSNLSRVSNWCRFLGPLSQWHRVFRSCYPIRQWESKWNRPETFEVWEIVQKRKIDSAEKIFIENKFTKISCCRNKPIWNFLKSIFVQIETLSLVSFCFRIQPIDFKAELPLRKETGSSLN